jgi:hypothetical protein
LGLDRVLLGRQILLASFVFGQIGMESGGASISGIVVGGPVSGAPDNPVTISLGLEEMNPEGLKAPLTSGILLGNHTLPDLSF